MGSQASSWIFWCALATLWRLIRPHSSCYVAMGWITSQNPRSWALTMRHVVTVLLKDGGPDLGELALGLLGRLAAAFLVRRDAERAQQLGRGGARVAGLAEHRMQSFGGQMPEDQVDDAPGVVGFRRVHEPRKRLFARKCGLNVRHRLRATGLRWCLRDVKASEKPGGAMAPMT